MESRMEQAVEKKKQGYNCAQAVACTYCDYAKMDEPTMAALAKTLGVGLGATMEGTCGAITGACIVAGLFEQQEASNKAVQDAKYIVNEFKKRNSTITCKELKGRETGVVLRSCEDCVRDAAEFLESCISPILLEKRNTQTKTIR